MESKYNTKMQEVGYDQFVCDIFSQWEDVKDEILLSERKEGSGNGTVHVFLGAADASLRAEFADYYTAVEGGEDPAIGAVRVKHYFLKSNVLSMFGYLCEFYTKKSKDFKTVVSNILTHVSFSKLENEMLTTYSLFKLSTGSSRLRPYFKQFEDNGVFYKVIRQLLLPKSAYKISLYKNDKGEYAAFWLIGFANLEDFEADSSKDYIKPQTQPLDHNLPLQQIFYGAPGTGKSRTIKDQTAGKDVIRTTFHPDTDYSTFVGAYKPTTKTIPVMTVIGTKAVAVEDGQGKPVPEYKIVYEFVPQAFLLAYVAAWLKLGKAEGTDLAEPEFLVIEEINRGNCAQIFGDLFQLLDRQDCGFSEYPIKADADMKRFLTEALKDLDLSGIGAGLDKRFDGENIARQVKEGDILMLPNNLYIWATMNTSDQSLFPIDSAFKRRWDWQYVPINDAGMGWTIRVCGSDYSWWDFLEEINRRIYEATYSEDKKLGYFFCKAKDGVIDAERFVGKVVFYLWNDVFKDTELEGDAFRDTDGSKLTFDKFYTVVAGKTVAVEEKAEVFLKNLGLAPMALSTGDETDVDKSDN